MLSNSLSESGDLVLENKSCWRCSGNTGVNSVGARPSPNFWNGKQHVNLTYMHNSLLLTEDQVYTKRSNSVFDIGPLRDGRKLLKLRR